MNELLIAQVVRRSSNKGTQIELIGENPPKIANSLSSFDEKKAEMSLGFTVPEILKTIYRKIGNGGFGPGYGLLGLIGGAKDDLGHDSVELYHNYSAPGPEDPEWRWPNGLLPICHWGCAIYSCVDCNENDFPIIIFDPNFHDKSWPQCFISTEKNLERWFNAWVNDISLWDETYGQQET